MDPTAHNRIMRGKKNNPLCNTQSLRYTAPMSLLLLLG